MNIFESLENLEISEECFNDIMDIVEEILSEGRELQNVVIRTYNKGKIDSDKFGKLVGKALDTPSDGVSFYHEPKEERNSMTNRSNQVNIKQFSGKVDKKRAKEFDNLTSEEKVMKRAQEKNK